MKNGYQVINCSAGDPRYVNYDEISNHRTLEGAIQSFRKRNWWLYDKKLANQRGLQNTRSFDRIIQIEDGEVVDYDVYF